VVQPAVASGPSIFRGDLATQSVTIVTDVNVDATPMQDLAYRWNGNRPSIVTVGGAVGAALVGLIKWSGSLAESVRRARSAWRPADADRAQSPQDEQSRAEDRDRAGYL
jgi:hypothetical protein